MRQERLKPTQKYPKILWYQVKNTPPTEKEYQILVNRHYERLVDLYTIKYPNATAEDIEQASREQAVTGADQEISKPTLLKKVVVNNLAEHQNMIKVIESSSDFLKWYEK